MARPRKIDDHDALDRAVDVFWKQGITAVSIRDLEVALDLRAPSIYRRFHSKDQLLVRCIDRYVEREVGRRLRHFLADADDPMIGLRRFFDSALRHHTGEERLRGCLLTITAGDASALTPDVQSAVDAGFAAIEQAFGLQIERAKAVGQLDADVDATMLAKALLLSFQGLLLLARSGASDLHAAIDATFGAIAPSS